MVDDPSNASLEAAANLLEASGRYRVLRRLDAPSALARLPEAAKIGLILDVETTGLDVERDEIIELAMLKFAFVGSGEMIGLVSTFNEFNEPTSGIPEEITDLTGITADDVTRDRIASCGLISENGNFIFPDRSLIFPFMAGGSCQYIQARYFGTRKNVPKWIGLNGVARILYNTSCTVGANEIYMCEGVMDVLSAHELGHPAIGLLGGHMRLFQANMVELRGKSVYIVPDNDKTGRDMANRLSSKFLEYGSRGTTAGFATSWATSCSSETTSTTGRPESSKTRRREIHPKHG